MSDLIAYKIKHYRNVFSLLLTTESPPSVPKIAHLELTVEEIPLK